MLARANDRLVALEHEEAPRSCSKEAKLAFLHLPPETQVYYAAHESSGTALCGALKTTALMFKKLTSAEARIAELEAKLDGPAIQKTPEVTYGNSQIAAA